MSVAERLAIKVAGLVMTTGGPVALNVVKVLSLPRIIPALFMATIRKWYVVFAVKLLILAATF